ncbi:DUF4402 domain-containing protein [Thermodesulfatator autotrophicus]|uniref:DUF4402 domain-containing protein n=1 Tax=Thermodesulfatator autotrophicus TaxID=1795632 RepID=A0A177E4H8_9BACT|nr:DUF4402 domain-containing protein [Thermodesulfatator autotrophicus]OAG26698.1 hypothetical protein TH606_10950 [Thermodesulfatator autotrophicus]
MRKVLLFSVVWLAMVALLQGLASAETATANVTGTLYSSSSITVNKVSDLSFSAVVADSGETVDFSTTGSYTPAQFEVSGAAGASVSITVQSTGSRDGSVDVVEEASGYHFDLTVVCRVSADAMPASPTDGVDCDSGITIPDAGTVYVAVFPSLLQKNLASAYYPFPGTYSGTVTIEVNYE